MSKNKFTEKRSTSNLRVYGESEALAGAEALLSNNHDVFKHIFNQHCDRKSTISIDDFKSICKSLCIFPQLISMQDLRQVMQDSIRESALLAENGSEPSLSSGAGSSSRRANRQGNDTIPRINLKQFENALVLTSKLSFSSADLDLYQKLRMLFIHIRSACKTSFGVALNTEIQYDGAPPLDLSCNSDLLRGGEDYDLDRSSIRNLDLKDIENEMDNIYSELKQRTNPALYMRSSDDYFIHTLSPKIPRDRQPELRSKEKYHLDFDKNVQLVQQPLQKDKITGTKSTSTAANRAERLQMSRDLRERLKERRIQSEDSRLFRREEALLRMTEKLLYDESPIDKQQHNRSSKASNHHHHHHHHIPDVSSPKANGKTHTTKSSHKSDSKHPQGHHQSQELEEFLAMERMVKEPDEDSLFSNDNINLSQTHPKLSIPISITPIERKESTERGQNSTLNDSSLDKMLAANDNLNYMDSLNSRDLNFSPRTDCSSVNGGTTQGGYTGGNSSLTKKISSPFRPSARHSKTNAGQSGTGNPIAAFTKGNATKNRYKELDLRTSINKMEPIRSISPRNIPSKSKLAMMFGASNKSPEKKQPSSRVSHKQPLHSYRGEVMRSSTQTIMKSGKLRTDSKSNSPAANRLKPKKSRPVNGTDEGNSKTSSGASSAKVETVKTSTKKFVDAKHMFEKRQQALNHHLAIASRTGEQKASVASQISSNGHSDSDTKASSGAGSVSKRLFDQRKSISSSGRKLRKCSRKQLDRKNSHSSERSIQVKSQYSHRTSSNNTKQELKRREKSGGIQDEEFNASFEDLVVEKEEDGANINLPQSNIDRKKHLGVVSMKMSILEQQQRPNRFSNQKSNRPKSQPTSTKHGSSSKFSLIGDKLWNGLKELKNGFSFGGKKGSILSAKSGSKTNRFIKSGRSDSSDSDLKMSVASKRVTRESLISSDKESMQTLSLGGSTATDFKSSATSSIVKSRASKNQTFTEETGSLKLDLKQASSSNKENLKHGTRESTASSSSSSYMATKSNRFAHGSTSQTRSLASAKAIGSKRAKIDTNSSGSIHHIQPHSARERTSKSRVSSADKVLTIRNVTKRIDSEVRRSNSKTKSLGFSLDLTKQFTKSATYRNVGKLGQFCSILNQQLNRRCFAIMKLNAGFRPDYKSQHVEDVRGSKRFSSSSEEVEFNGERLKNISQGLRAFKKTSCAKMYKKHVIKMQTIFFMKMYEYNA
eukprot:CAMPEP_0115009384 /NCGR_PEP_ID=MMETSP0216-20121206/22577_1 /TAXON_ID=223996 /ORGANISM="Protocruzia adherens, Strain Boccale" /LENGTH=1220 /DNA_ID=CAMNT_0002377175 /DNA_START=193 /DNA_END=3855 /DNA_ORIENTATION=-